METLNEMLKLNIKFRKSGNNNLTEIQKNKIYNLYKIDFDKFSFQK